MALLVFVQEATSQSCMLMSVVPPLPQPAQHTAAFPAGVAHVAGACTFCGVP